MIIFLFSRVAFAYNYQQLEIKDQDDDVIEQKYHNYNNNYFTS